MTLSQHGSYHHIPLPDGPHIRLIKVHAAADFSSNLTCDLETVKLDTKPEYSALSYAWEGQTPSVPILCTTGSHTGALLITPNCAAALRQLRHESGSLTIWIDSICIDQTSIDERSSQVALMGEIYKAAKQVVVWLGERNERVVAAIGLLRKLSTQTMDKDSMQSMTPESAQKLRAEFYARAKRLTKDVSTDEQDLLHPLFQLSWFTRMWTVQEIALNFKGLINCGGVTLPWTDLIVAVDVLGAIDYKFGGWNRVLQLQKYLAVSLLIENYPQGKRIINENNIRSGVSNIDNEFDIFRTFLYAREKQSSDPKDRIFALYAVLAELGVKLPLPDYRKTLAEIYADATLTLIEHDQSLVVLHFVTSANRRKDLPSWVPDFTDRVFDEGDTRFPITRARFGAGGSLESKWETRARGSQLLVRGKIIDRVMYRGQRLPLIDPRDVNVSKLLHKDANGTLSLTDTFRSLRSAIQIFREWCDVSLWSASYPNGESIQDALRTTLLNDYPRSMNDAACMSAFATWFQYMTKPEESDSQLHAGSENSPARIAAELKRFSTCFSGPGLPFHAVAMPFCSNKTFYRTEQGWFGTAPEFIPDPVQAGDVILSIRGMAMPVILRPLVETGGYQLISHCYVHGFMYGEAWEEGSNYRETSILIV